MLYRFIILLPFLLVTLSCSEFLKSSSKKEEAIKFEDSRLDCLDVATEVLRKFDRSQTQPDQVKASLQCFQSSLEYFKSKTKGSVEDPDNYTISNLRAFFSKFLGDNSRVSEGLAKEMMKLKSALFGGSELSMSRAELQALISFGQSMQLEIERLKPYWHTLLVSDLKEQLSSQKVNRAHAQFLKSLETLLLQTQLPKSGYGLEDFKSLVMELEKFINNDESKKQELVKWMPLVDASKRILFGEHVEINSFAKWKEAIRMVSEIHRFYMLYVYQFDALDFYSKEGIQSGDELLVLSLKLIESSWVLKSSEIPFSSTQDLFNALEERNLLPKNITGQGVDETYRGIVVKALERESRNAVETVMGLERKHIATLKTEYEIWRSTQNFIDQMPDTFEYSDLEKKLEAYQVRTKNVFAVAQPKNILEAWKDWKSHFAQKIPLLYLTTGELHLVPNVKEIKKWPWYSLARLNVMRTLTRSLTLGYGVNRTMVAADEKLNEKSLFDWYADYGKIGVEMKAFDPRSGNSGARSFFEADHFTMSGNGDGLIDRQEVFEFVNIIFSSGLSGLASIQDHMSVVGCHLPEKDVYDNFWLDEACFRDQMKTNFSWFFKNLNGLYSYVNRMDAAAWDEFYTELMGFSRTAGNKPGKIETSDIRTFVVILHYIESMYIQFDQNRDDRLSKDELIQASSRFVRFFREYYKLTSEPDSIREKLYKYVVSQGFACMVLTGKMPTFTSCSKVFLQDAWQDRYSDRLRILKTLNQLKVQVQ